MNRKEILNLIREELIEAKKNREMDAVNMYLVIKFADELQDMNGKEFSRAVGRKDSYETEFMKGLKLAKIIKQRGSF
jgi:hypothetical protein